LWRIHHRPFRIGNQLRVGRHGSGHLVNNSVPTRDCVEFGENRERTVLDSEVNSIL
jgi:hypothetical protein